MTGDQPTLFGDDDGEDDDRRPTPENPVPHPGPIVGRGDGANSHLAARRIEPKLGTRRRLVLDALRRAQGGWVDGTVLETSGCGGSQGTRRARELRAAGWPIEIRPNPYSATAWQYRLIPERPAGILST